MNRTERLSKLLSKLTKLQTAIRKEGMNDVADKMSDASMLLSSYVLKEYAKEYQSDPS